MNDALRAASRREQLVTMLGWALMTLSPFLLLGAVSLALGHSALDTAPVWTDELDYWRTLLSWREVGFHTGYSGMYEECARLGTLGVNGPTAILLYGWFVWLFGLNYHSILLCNAVWISLASAVYCALHRPRPAVSLFLAGVLVLYAPIVLYCLTSMTELFNYALLLFYLAFLMRYEQRRQPWALALCCLTVLLACVYRPFYCLLFLPIVLVYSRFRFNWRMLGSIVVSVMFTLACIGLRGLVMAPYAQGFLHHLMQAQDPATFVQMLLSHTKANLADYFLHAAHPMETAQRWLFLGVTALCAVFSFARPERDESRRVRVQLGFEWGHFACFLLLAGAFGIVCMLYETNDWRDYRMLAPCLWLALAYLAHRGRRLIPTAALAGMAATLVLLCTLPATGAFSDEARFTRPAHDADLSEAIALITYDPAASDPLVNTVRLDVPGLQVAEEIPAGMGLQYGWFTTETTGKSNWILTDNLKCMVNGYERVPCQSVYKVYRLVAPDEVDGE